MTHGSQRQGVEPGAHEEPIQVLFFKRSEDTAARRIDEQRDLRPLLFQEGLDLPDILRIRKVQGDGPDGLAALFPQFHQALLPPGDDPDLIQLHPAVHRIDKFSPDPGGGAGDHRDPHRLVLPIVCFFYCSTPKGRLQTKKRKVRAAFRFSFLSFQLSPVSSVSAPGSSGEMAAEERVAAPSFAFSRSSFPRMHQ